MTDKEFYPLTSACVRALNDKLYDKRKGAALEIEKLMKDAVKNNDAETIKRVLKVVGEDFALSQNPNIRKGGLIGLAATAIGLGKESTKYINELARPVIVCFHDSDHRVRYYACESLYNIVKVVRGSILPFFNEIFDALSKLSSDPEQNVKNGAELLDRLIKDIVTESSSFDLAAFIPLLRERIYTKNTFARQFVVSWIGVLDAVPDINMLVLLPEILDGLFQILGDSSIEIRKLCQNILAEFLEGIKKSKNGVNFTGMANILIVHSQNSIEIIQCTAIKWLREFVVLSGRAMLPHMAGMLGSVLPCLAYSDEHTKSIREAAEQLNTSLRKLIEKEDDLPTPTQESQIKNTENVHSSFSKYEPSYPCVSIIIHISNPVQLEVSSVIKVLKSMLSHDAVQTRVASLKWFNLLLSKTPNKTFRHIDDFFTLLLDTLADPSDDVVLLDLEVLAEVSSNSVGNADLSSKDEHKLLKMKPGLNQYFTVFIIKLMDFFKNNKQILDDRGTFIIRQLSVYLSAEAIFRAMAEYLETDSDVNFCCTMVQTLNTILLTSTELYDLRSLLKDLKNKESCSLFVCLYKCWCHSPIAAMSLCYLSQNYHHAAQLLQTFGDLEITVDFLKEIDKLVQLIESPIFAYLRLQLLDTENNQDLLHSLYGLLMILPQSEAFKLLHYRLECVPKYHPSFKSSTGNNTHSQRKEQRPLVARIDFNNLLQHFLHVQSKHKLFKKQQIALKLQSVKKLAL
ncbi:hypothetical protein LOTGIDRAFT_119746 [Lottia gigantea]|uniref:Protein VAC14 homolog n=1 Tax=Lottia gigantea TaxID=225164 RepID=V4BVL4_LOTGI|nr:hypothetical protein LOTGIDRAFT_119746 [Lottia gigantea]ESO93069.1 hypothetical protein LOTGIDRAFT_119746 [Lottia gigantea]